MCLDVRISNPLHRHRHRARNAQTGCECPGSREVEAEDIEGRTEHGERVKCHCEHREVGKESGQPARPWSGAPCGPPVEGIGWLQVSSGSLFHQTVAHWSSWHLDTLRERRTWAWDYHRQAGVR